MILVIAEKPSLGRDIADALPGARGRGDRRYIEKGDYIVTWVFGHMLTLKEPEDYDKRYKKWSIGDLPIYFDKWEKKIGADTAGFESKRERLELIGELLDRADSVIHAGDPDEEGQLLIDELLEWFDYKKPVMRLDTGDTTKGGLTKALSRLRDNRECMGQGRSAYARTVADMMMGVNISRYFTCMNRGVLLSVGRVQTPTLGLVVARDMQIEGHTKTVYYDIYAELDVTTPDGVKRIRAKYTPKNKDAEKIINRSEAEQILKSVLSKEYTTVIERKTVNESPPLPFNLVKLQSYCSSHFGYTPQEVMDITQSLREKHKAITYNRSDCQYLSEEHFKEAPQTMEQVIQNINYRPKLLDMAIHSKCFNDENITAHFAIIPTNNSVVLERLTDEEKNVYLAICKYYMAQFMPDAVKEKSKLVADSGGDYTLNATSSMTVTQGYLSIFKDIEAEEQTVLSTIPAGTYLSVAADGNVEEKETKPPSRYTKASLNEDMTRIAKYVTDERIKKLLEEKDKDKKGENGSIGTSATRSSIIEGLIKKGYLKEKGKTLISTPLGRELYRILPDEIKKADMTAEWWVIQEDIKCGTKDAKALTDDVLSTIKRVLKEDYPKVDQTVMNNTISERNNTVIGTCPLCGGNIIETKTGFGCVNFRPPMSCKFVIWKKFKNGLFSKTNFTKTKVKALLAGKTVTCKKLISLRGDEFEADVKLNVNPAGKHGPAELKVVFPDKK